MKLSSKYEVWISLVGKLRLDRRGVYSSLWRGEVGEIALALMILMTMVF